MPTSGDNGQMAHIVQESRAWVQVHGFDMQSNQELSTRDAIKIALASHDYVVERISHSLSRPMWGVAGALLFNGAVQFAKWVLGS